MELELDLFIHSNRLQKAYTCTSDAGPAQVKGFNARHPGADTQDGQIVDICLGQRKCLEPRDMSGKNFNPSVSDFCMRDIEIPKSITKA